MATLALDSGLWVRRLLNSFGEGCANDGSPCQGRYPASEVNDGTCPEKPVHLTPQIPRDLKRVDQAITRSTRGLWQKRASGRCVAGTSTSWPWKSMLPRKCDLPSGAEGRGVHPSMLR
jgi:hypothetical protein